MCLLFIEKSKVECDAIAIDIITFLMSVLRENRVISNSKWRSEKLTLARCIILFTIVPPPKHNEPVQRRPVLTRTGSNPTNGMSTRLPKLKNRLTAFKWVFDVCLLLNF